MKADGMNSKRSSVYPAVAIMASTVFALSACAGSVGARESAAEAGQGFEYGTPQDEVDQLVEDLEPVTLTFQPVASSADSILSPAATVIKELIEERSNGKINVKIVWGQAIAGYDTVDDALADGRLDLAYTLPIYQPAEYPVFNDLATSTSLLPPSPFVGELLPYAVYNDIGWSNEALLDTYEEKGLVPLTPFVPAAGYYSYCRKPTLSKSDWHGTQASMGSAALVKQMRGIGAAPVSMAYTETYEALQRGTVDCSMGPSGATAEGGLLEVAPNVGYTTDSSFPRAAGAFLAGNSFADLPTAYKQIIFDSNSLAAGGVVRGQVDGVVEAVKQSKANGGEVVAFDDEIQSMLADSAESLVDDAAAGGSLGTNPVRTISSSADRWTEKLESMGYKDLGDTETVDDWLDEDVDYSDFAKAVYESSAAMEHRPD